MGLRKLRKSRGLTLHALADLTGICYVRIHCIETGKTKVENITLRNALKLAKALDCKPEELLGKEADDNASI